MPKVSQRSEARFWAKVEKVGDCWLWTAYRDQTGYGRLTSNKESFWAHRFSYELVRGPIPEGMQIDHLCRNRACVNPWHLEPVTPAENVRRGLRGSSHVTHCPAGHPYSGTNLYEWADRKGYTRRYCKTCVRASSLRSYYKSKTAAA